jgi:hypothetical protein
MRGRLLAVVVLALGLTACVVVDSESGPTETYTESVDAGSAQNVVVNLQMGTGALTIRRGGRHLVESTFRYAASLGRPAVRYEIHRAEGRLNIESPRGRFSTGHSSNAWELQFGDAVPLEFDIQIGAGESRVDASHLPVRRVDVQMGAGKLDLNLSGRYGQDVLVSVQGGVGQALIDVPHDFGAVADVKGGIGTIQPGSLERRRDGLFVNRAYEEGKPAVRLTVRGGVGEVRLAEGN